MNKNVSGKAVWLIGAVLAMGLGACSEASTGSCNENLLRKLRDVRFESLKVVTKYAEEPDPQLSPYLKAYYQDDELKGLDLKNSGEYGFTEYRYWVLTGASFLVDQRESWYDQPIDPKEGPKVAQRIGNLFFVCDTRMTKVEPLSGFEPFKDPNDQVHEIIRVFRDINAINGVKAEVLW